MPFVYKMHNGINDLALFSDFILESVACGFLRYGDILVLDNAAIHHYKDLSELLTDTAPAAEGTAAENS